MLAKPIYINCGAAAQRQPCKQWSGRAALALPARRHILLAQHRHALAVAAAMVPLGAGVVVDAAARKSHWSASIPWRGGRRNARPCCLCISGARRCRHPSKCTPFWYNKTKWVDIYVRTIFLEQLFLKWKQGVVATREEKDV
jgi:hypothetical protein